MTNVPHQGILQGKGHFMENKNVIFSLDGMKCVKCINKINESLLDLDFSIESKFNLEKKEVSISFNQKEGQVLQIKKQIEEAGFKITKMS